MGTTLELPAAEELQENEAVQTESDSNEAVEAAEAGGDEKATPGEGDSTEASTDAASPPTPTAEDHYEERLHEAEQDYCEVSLEVASIDGMLKDAKSRQKTALEHLKDIRRRGPESYPLFDGDKTSTQSSESPSAPRDSQPAADADAWRQVEVGRLNLTDAQVSRLIELEITTIGQLEDVRAGDGLLSLKGVGQKKADAIEEALIDWLTKNRDAEAFKEAAAASSEDQPFSPVDYANELVEEYDQGNTSVATAQKNDPAWQEGYDAHFKGLPLEACPEGEDYPRAAWVQGWVTYHVTDAEEEATQPTSGELEE